MLRLQCLDEDLAFGRLSKCSLACIRSSWAEHHLPLSQPLLATYQIQPLLLHRHSVFNSNVLRFLIYQCPFPSIAVIVLSFSHFCVINIFITSANPLYYYLPQFFLSLFKYM